jgi:3-deoxy-D-manno-octulosonic-acid transferase
MWFHVASLGELEQAIPVMQAFRAAHPATPWLLTVYSPSAWHPLQTKGLPNTIPGWHDGDLAAVLPDDHPGTWRTWLDTVPFRALALAKYDLWPNLLAACRSRNLPVHAFAASPSGTRANPTPSTPVLWHLLTSISVQDAAAAEAFARIGLTANVTVDGDPRVERVLSRPASPPQAWTDWAASASQVVVAGSTWPEEERALRTLDWHPDRRLVLVPHDLSSAHLAALEGQWEGGAIRASLWQDLEPAARDRWSVVIVDSTGMLFDLYRIGTVALVGGGHGTGLHNVLEPASAGLPIVTGPDLGAFREAHALQELGTLTSGDVADLTNAWLADAASCRQFGAAGLAWLHSQQGASQRIVGRWVLR